MQRIEILKADPFPQGSIKLSDGEGLYRCRAGDYRIVYSVDTATATVTVEYIRHRGEVYRAL